ncbi:MAG: ApbE family lipoprotein [Oscillospiraceae bacterium]|nr:ApbE family lipoprotein [Oscillospiraceae bacterium]
MALLLFLTGCSSFGRARYRAQFLGLFDTVTEIVGYSQSKELFTEQVKQIQEELQQYHMLYDIYQEYEGIVNLKTLNNEACKAPVSVDQKIIDLLIFSKRMHTETQGSVNIAFGSVLKLWKQYREQGIEDPENAELPPMKALKEAALHTNVDDIIIDEQNLTVFFKDPALQLDVGAVAKGFAVEAVCKSAQARGVNNMLVSVGGNVRAIGRKSLWEPFVVSLKNPDTEAQNASLISVRLSGEALVSSGDYLRYYTVGGKQYHHIIDSETLLPAEHYRSVSILSSDSGIADALSTAAYLMPFEQSKALVQKFPNTEALWIFPDGSIQMTTGFEKRIKQ